MARREGEFGGRQGVFVWHMMGGVGAGVRSHHHKANLTQQYG
ncbi:MAG: hypothetical protein AAFO83_04775 [Cyanobacteria bacterium J06607_13]